MSARSIRKTIAPLGHLADGTPFWALFGSDGTDDGGDDDGGGQGGAGDDGDDDDSDGEDEDDDKPGQDGLTAKGRKALQAERASADRARKRLKPFAQLARETGLTPEEMRERLLGKGGTSTKATGKNGKDDDDALDPDEIRREARREANEKVNTKLIKSAVRAEAASLLNDPADAARYLDLSDYEVDDDGEVDAKQIQRDLRALLADKPYLGKAKKGDGRNGGNPDFDGGSRSTSRKTNMSDRIRRAAGVIN